ncbi:hypothetical protein EYF80_066840 [Liparis tanakae]|uniref:Uncharacterized protein n=1 Tax=Liparis tanakae TaxID=230148 RepID=A0A4Z2E2U0_9TELE|nr:hypothetical protein EYF80_066840 [Liparis tanakae]
MLGRVLVLDLALGAEPKGDLTSDGRADEVGDGVQEVDHAQRRGQRPRPHHLRRHHGDERHVGAVEVTVDHGEGNEEREGGEERSQEAAEALHGHGQEVGGEEVGLQTPGRQGGRR